MDYSREQKYICEKYNTHSMDAPSFFKVGIALNVKEGLLPLNGLRHPPEGNSSGWYIWAGQVLSNDPEFFVPLHIEHLPEWCPDAIKYLGLPPGWRFLFTPSYEDVWEDKSLLEI